MNLKELTNLLLNSLVLVLGFAFASLIFMVIALSIFGALSGGSNYFQDRCTRLGEILGVESKYHEGDCYIKNPTGWSKI